MSTQPDPVRVSDVVRRAVLLVDPDGASDDATALLQRFEDSDEPVSTLEDPGAAFAEAGRSIDADLADPRLAMAVALATYLAFRRDQLDSDGPDLLQRAARAEFPDGPPPHVADWLAMAGTA